MINTLLCSHVIIFIMYIIDTQTDIAVRPRTLRLERHSSVKRLNICVRPYRVGTGVSTA